uniref:EGF-like domain-containing protein n=1 Tax=Ditylum brightwellii TaxID=49249 RepID=A0A7S1ZKN3_9STRA|mmetsp:Transcript_3389/g.5201  ORF Transcript_3389/g.5201 Transcript_3389/m.5201 type:complete len:222 (+) Transcript_3389:171-836(+)
MGDDIDTCPDGHFCLNGSMCVEIDGDEGNYFCDCDIAFDKNGAAHEGLKCQHKATKYCTYDIAVSKHSFCTNGGDCIAEVSQTEAHMGCRCGDNYEGEHCQFVTGTRPEGWPYNQAPSQSVGSKSAEGGGGGLGGGGIFGIILLVFSVTFLIAFMVHRTTKKKRESDEGAGLTKGKTKTDHDAALQLEADGGVLKEAIDDMKNEEDKVDDDDDEGSEGEII